MHSIERGDTKPLLSAKWRVDPVLGRLACDTDAVICWPRQCG